MSLEKIAPAAKELVTADGLMQMSPEDKKYELVKGELVEMTPPGGRHGNIAARLGGRLQIFAADNQLGVVMVETGFRLAAQPDTVRGPDISFLAAASVPSDGLPDDYISGPPDLAVEIVSPHDTASEIQAKVQDYLTYGSRLVWVVYPRQRLIIVHYPDGTAKTLQAKDTLSGEKIIPGFSCSVADIFS